MAVPEPKFDEVEQICKMHVKLRDGGVSEEGMSKYYLRVSANQYKTGMVTLRPMKFLRFKIGTWLSLCS